MIQTKQTYEAPTAQTFVVRFEGAILKASTDGVSIQNWQDGDTELDF